MSMILAQNEGYKSALIHASRMVKIHGVRVSNKRYSILNFGIILSLWRENIEKYRIFFKRFLLSMLLNINWLGVTSNSIR